MKEQQLTDAAVKNHKELFPERVSTMQKTDPEFNALFDNWAFDEVIAQSKLDAKTRVMLILASNIACQALGEYRLMVGAALNVGVSPVAIKEVVYQCVPYVGMAKVFDFLNITNEVLANRGIALPLEGQSTTDRENRHAKGLAAQEAIFGNVIDRLYKNASPDQLHMQYFLSNNCFGDYYTRGGLDLPMRELLTFCMLISMGGCEPQAKAHVTGNIHVGNSRALLIDAVTQLLPYIGYPRSLNALRIIDEVVPAPTVSEEQSK